MKKEVTSQVNINEIKLIISELESVIAKNIPGDVVEFGCYVGTTSIHLAKTLINSGKKLFLYDSFEGLPEKTIEDESPLGIQFVRGELSVTKKQLIKNLKMSNVPLPKIKKAWFSDLGKIDLPKQIAFAYIDCDYYKSVRDSLVLIGPFMAKGATILIDDYTNQSLPGAAKAVDEWSRQYGLRISYQESIAILHL